MTSYSISIGYQSGGKREEALAALLVEAETLRHDPARLHLEVIRFGCDNDDVCSGGDALAYCQVYARGKGEGGPLRIFEDAETEEPYLSIAASGGTSPCRCRQMKEQTARAFCRLLLAAMHMKGYEVCIQVS